jgi:hypothetical protein
MQRLAVILISILVFFANATCLLAEQAPSASPPVIVNPSTGSDIGSPQATFRTPYEFWLTCAIMLWGCIMLGSLIFMYRKVDGRRIEDLARPVIVVSVVIAVLMLATAGYANEQVAAAYGLFGSILGYLFGRRGRPIKRRSPDKSPSSN